MRNGEQKVSTRPSGGSFGGTCLCVGTVAGGYCCGWWGKMERRVIQHSGNPTEPQPARPRKPSLIDHRHPSSSASSLSSADHSLLSCPVPETLKTPSVIYSRVYSPDITPLWTRYDPPVPQGPSHSTHRSSVITIASQHNQYLIQYRPPCLPPV